MALHVNAWAHVEGDCEIDYTVSREDGSIEIQFGGRRDGFNVDLVPQAARRLADTVSAAVHAYEARTEAPVSPPAG